MSWTNNLKIYAEEATAIKLLDNATYTSNTQRTDGASANEPISSRLMNTCLKNLTTVMVALINALAEDATTTATINTDTSASDLKTILLAGLKSVQVSSAGTLRGTWHFIVQDKGNAHSQTTDVVFNPSDGNITFKLPEYVTFTTITGRLIGNADDLQGWAAGLDEYVYEQDGSLPIAPTTDSTWQFELGLQYTDDTWEVIAFPLITFKRHDLYAGILRIL